MDYFYVRTGRKDKVFKKTVITQYLVEEKENITISNDYDGAKITIKYFDKEFSFNSISAIVEMLDKANKEA